MNTDAPGSSARARTYHCLAGACPPTVCMAGSSRGSGLTGNYCSTLEKSSINPSRIRRLESRPRFHSCKATVLASTPYSLSPFFQQIRCYALVGQSDTPSPVPRVRVLQVLVRPRGSAVDVRAADARHRRLPARALGPIPATGNRPSIARLLADLPTGIPLAVGSINERNQDMFDNDGLIRHIGVTMETGSACFLMRRERDSWTQSGSDDGYGPRARRGD